MSSSSVTDTAAAGADPVPGPGPDSGGGWVERSLTISQDGEGEFPELSLDSLLLSLLRSVQL